MKTMSAWLVASALTVSLLYLPAGLTAQEKRGAEIIVTKLDGSQVRGELIAVRPDSLLLLNHVGSDASISHADIKTVRIIRRSRAGLFTAIGGGAAWIAGYAAYRAAGDEEQDNWAGLVGLFCGVLGATAGLATGALAGTDSEFAVVGQPETVVSGYWDKLRALSREGRIRVVPIPSDKKPGPAPKAGISGPGTIPPAAPHVQRHGPRFRLALAGTLSFVDTRLSDYQSTGGLWRFPGAVPPGEAGPYPLTFNQVKYRGMNAWIVVGPISLAYEWKDRWLPEIELFLMGRGNGSSGWANIDFVSTVDGRTYRSSFSYTQDARFNSLLVGMSYRPVVPSLFKRTSIEIGVAVGPAQIKVSPPAGSSALLPTDQKVVLSARFHAGYDFFFFPAVSLGVFFGYRYLEASFPAMTGTQDLDFWDLTDPGPYITPAFTRPAETTFPERRVSRSGLTYGLRVTFRL